MALFIDDIQHKLYRYTHPTFKGVHTGHNLEQSGMDFNKRNDGAFEKDPVSFARSGDVEPLIALAKQSVASGILELGISMGNS